MASSGGLSNADFARMFCGEAQREIASRIPDTSDDITATTNVVYELKQGEEDRQLEDVSEASRKSHLETNISSGSSLGPSRSVGVGLGLQLDSGSGLGFTENKKNIRVSKLTETKTYSWEKHTTGFGTKMLAKMGFKGRLGKMEDGVSATIEVKKRPAQMGMGYGDFVEASNLKQNRKLQKELQGENAGDEETNYEARYGLEDDSLWRKRLIGSCRQRHKRAADLMQEVHDMKKHRSNDIVLDMRGPSVRVLTDMKAAYHVDLQHMTPKLGDELVYNICTLLNLTKGKLYDLTQKISVNKESLTGIKMETKMMTTQLDVNDVQQQHIEGIIKQLKILDSLREDAFEMKSVESLLTHLRRIRQHFPIEFDAHKLLQLVPSICIPPLRALLTELDLLDPISNDRIVLQLRLVRAFLTESPRDTVKKNIPQVGSVLPIIREKTIAEGSDLYNFILEDTLWPALAHCVNVDWQAKANPLSCINLFLKVRLHLSSELENAFIHRLVFVRLKKECQHWDPQSDTISIQEWLLPWLPYVGAAMVYLYPDIRLALASALNQWHPSDLSILSILSPWRELWGEREYGKFTHRHIMRKLIRCLHREFEINPEEQSLEALTWVLAWRDCLPDRQLVALLEGEFFPKWLKALRKWVDGSPNLIELEKWYCGWKLLFERNKLATNDRLLIHFHGALVLLQIATDSVFGSSRTVPELNGYAATSYQDALVLARDASGRDELVQDEKTLPRKTVAHRVSLKDAIENMAINHNLTFMPKGYHDGQQIYMFGERKIIIEQGVVFAEDFKNVFKPVDLEQLLIETSGKHAC
ncbi:stip-like protein [Plasmopara halstedii]|uniref:Stip-like protein n=1 Tax=Plasmopara halstedii TaxID=4781 RepID=A0A0P1A5J0_PLAHL|nr:stip-like protein [Plasmopara halstedii]CEG35174.1 stip-like protein [Plasmopara halstedii]|eukprot:XP_024571543.1 stip-like protein [Plasmopara halstedii]